MCARLQGRIFTFLVRRVGGLARGVGNFSPHTGEISGLAAHCNFGYFGGFRDLSNNEYVFWVGVAACAGRIQRTVMEQVCNSSLYLSVRITSNLLIIKITSVALENT